MRKCSVEGCDRKHNAKGFCQKHYEYWRHHGVSTPPTEEERFWAKVAEPDEQECRLWTAAVRPDGVGWFSSKEFGPVGAHLWLWRHVNGLVPRGLVVDHLCHNRDFTCAGGVSCKHRRCMTLEHMELTTIAENVRRGVQGRYQKPVCSFEDCELLAKARGLCGRHYEAWRYKRLLLA